MQQQQDMPVSGAAVYWILSPETHYDKFAEGLANLGYGDFVPERRSKAQALKSAVTQRLGGRGMLVRPLSAANSAGFAVVREEQGDLQNSYQNVCSVFLSEDTGTPLPTGTITEQERKILEAEFIFQQGLLSASQVSHVLEKIVLQDPVDGGLGGNKLKANGGLYWISEKKLKAWDALCKMVEECAVGHKASLVVGLRVIYDNHSVKAVMDAITREVMERAKEIQRDIAAGELTQRAYEHRSQDAEHLHDRIAAAEAMLGEKLEQLHDLASRTETSVMDAAVRALPDIFGKD